MEFSKLNRSRSNPKGTYSQLKKIYAKMTFTGFFLKKIQNLLETLRNKENADARNLGCCGRHIFS